MHPANPAISLVTRRWLSDVAARNPDMIDAPSLSLIFPALRECLKKHPGGMMFHLARLLGADETSSDRVGSACELFYAACSLSDDIQDEDAEKYMSVPLNLQINAQGHLLSLIAKNISEFFGNEAVVEAYSVLSRMVTGQRIEILREKWDTLQYVRVSELSAGTQIGYYCFLAATSAGKDDESKKLWRQWGNSLGCLMQICWDLVEKDDRLFCFSGCEICKMIGDFVGAVEESTKNLPQDQQAHARAMSGGMVDYAVDARKNMEVLAQL